MQAFLRQDLGSSARELFVDVGESDGMLTVIARGLAEGDRVVAQPSDTVRDGTQVRS